MPSTENTTLQRIQREISEVIEREKELRNGHHQKIDNNNENEIEEAPVEQKIENKPVLGRSKSAYPVLNGNQNQSNSSSNGVRLFTSNTTTKGVMQKFIKARGKLAVTNLRANSVPVHTWTLPDFIEPAKLTIEPGKCVRKGYVPVEERMRKEFQDYHNREMELRSDRRKSQPDFSALVDIESPKPEIGLRAARSMAQLYNADEFEESSSAPASLKPARSLAELCDASEDELDTPGSHSLIMQWENLIQKNQQARA